MVHLVVEFPLKKFKLGERLFFRFGEVYGGGMKRGMKYGVMGLLLGVALGVVGCGKPPVEVEGGKKTVQAMVSGEAALEEVRQFVELGPKESGMPGAERAATYLAGRLQAVEVEAQIQEFQEASPAGVLTFRNVLGRIPGTSDRMVLLGSHYDTKVGIEGFEGANDSGSGTGLLIELARVLKANGPHGLEIRFAFFDGEECQVEYGPEDGFHGSEYVAKIMAEDGSLSNVVAMILLDMVGDKDLTVTIPRNGSPELMALAFEAARVEGVRKHFGLYPGMISDDHVAFLNRGVPAIDLIDFEFGSAPGKNDYWHTAEDSMDKVSAESLEKVGRVTARMVEALVQREVAAKK